MSQRVVIDLNISVWFFNEKLAITFMNVGVQSKKCETYFQACICSNVF